MTLTIYQSLIYWDQDKYDVCKCISLGENISISLKYPTNGPINNSLVQVMAWCRAGDNPLFEPSMANFTSLGLEELRLELVKESSNLWMGLLPDR